MFENKRMLVFGVIALVFLFALVFEGFEDVTGADSRNYFSSVDLTKIKPDLQIASVDLVSPEEMEVSIYNSGSKDAEDREVVVAFFKEGTYGWDSIGSEHIDRVGSEKYVKFIYSYGKVNEDGDKIKIVVDRDNKITETDETNNEACFIVPNEELIAC